MINQLFLGLTLLGSEWVLIILLILSVLSIAMTLERWQFYKKASVGLEEFRTSIRALVSGGKWKDALEAAKSRHQSAGPKFADIETEMSLVLLSNSKKTGGNHVSPGALEQLANDAITRARIPWDKYLSILASIGSNTPFFGLFGTVLGIIKAFHDLSSGTAAAGGGGATQVSGGISEALVATAIGLFVAIPAVIAYNTFQRRVRTATQEADALKSYLIGNLMD